MALQSAKVVTALAAGFFTISLAALAAQSTSPAEPAASGLWQKLDEQTGDPVGWFLFVERDGLYQGVIAKLFLRPEDPKNPLGRFDRGKVLLHLCLDRKKRPLNQIELFQREAYRIDQAMAARTACVGAMLSESLSDGETRSHGCLLQGGHVGRRRRRRRAKHVLQEPLAAKMD